MPRPILQVLLALALVLAANHYWDPEPGKRPDQETSERHVALPKTYVQQARSWSFDEQGNLSDMLEAERVDQFSKGNYSMVIEPRFYSHSKDRKTWSATAERGRFEHGRERLLLRKNVVLSHDQTGTRMQSHMLDLNLVDKLAQSNKPVTITQGENRTTADGMVASLEQETIVLKPNVESIYVQSPRATGP
jgi:lipopolysaccharide export system protein LptC